MSPMSIRRAVDHSIMHCYNATAATLRSRKNRLGHFQHAGFAATPHSDPFRPPPPLRERVQVVSRLQIWGVWGENLLERYQLGVVQRMNF